MNQRIVSTILLLVGLGTTLTGQIALQIGRTYSGAISGSKGELYEGKRVIWHTVNVPSRQNLLVRAEADSDGVLYAILPDGRQLYNDDFFNTDPALLLIGVQGNVRIAFSFFSEDASGNYHLTVEPLPALTPIRGSEITGELTNQSTLVGKFPCALFSYTLTQPGAVAFRVESRFDNKLAVITPDRQHLLIDDDSGGGTNAQVVLRNLVPGEAILVVFPYNHQSIGPFKVIIDVSPPPERLTVGRAVNGTLTGQEPMLYKVQDGEANGREYVFSVRAGLNYVVRLNSNEFDTFLEVSVDGKSYSDDDSGGGTNAQVIFQAESDGEALVLARSYAPGATSGNFTIQAIELRPIQTFQGQLSRQTARDSYGRYQAVHEFRGHPGQFIIAELRSDQFDSYLIVQDASGNVLVENDDYGDSNHARVTFLMPANGQVRFLCTSYDSGSVGSYTLRVHGE